jgi:hypothetical protein
VRERRDGDPAARAARLPLPHGHLAFQPKWPLRRTKPPGGACPKARRLQPSVIALGTDLPLLPSNAAGVLLEHRKIAMQSQWADRKRRVVLPLLTHLIPHPMAVRTICLKMAVLRVVALKVVELKITDQEAAVQKEAVLAIVTLEAAALGIAELNVILPLNRNVKANNNFPI